MNRPTQKHIPRLPGVYFFKDAQGEIVYIGKAKSLRHRINSYFQNHTTDWKIEAIRSAYADLDFIVTKTETEALLLEAELIQRYQPAFNTIFKTGQPFVYIVFKTHKTMPTMAIMRNKKNKGTYFGPFLQKNQARSVYRFLMETFQLNACNKKIENGCLDYHIGNCPGTCMANFDREEYRFRLELAKDVLHRKDKAFIAKIKEKINTYNAQRAFEKSKRLNEYLENVETIFATIRANYSPKKFMPAIIAATAPSPQLKITTIPTPQLHILLGSDTPISTIDCFDISHFQSRSIVGSCVRFTDGKPDKNKFRRFRIKTMIQQNDYAALQEIVSRRYKDPTELPDLILIDGGKGQRNAVQKVIPKQQYVVSLAKKEELLFLPNASDGIKLDVKTELGKQLITLRDYAHHFAITYHRLRQRKEIPLVPRYSYK